MTRGKESVVTPKLARQLTILVAIAVCVSLRGQASDAAGSLRLQNADGKSVAPFAVPPQTKAIVFIFTSIDCPIANRYAPILNSLSAAFAPKGFVFTLVYPNPFETPAAVREHARSFSLPMAGLMDPDHLLSRLAGATVTPEAAVFRPDGHELYHGRIDNRYVSLGVERPAATRHDLEDALNATLAGKPPAEATAQAVGCFIGDFVK